MAMVRVAIGAVVIEWFNFFFFLFSTKNYLVVPLDCEAHV